ncbi:amidase [Achromobacter denitrificans]|uniref:amidase n=1 Tax=Achromobacter denitrificans TaxID=32002 RepID=UPI002432F25C|nr:amidase [Achromobacter denitrificans]MBV2160841.1 amidase [Achromobacter denitrificans]MDX3877954.1 amidase [Achromobacter sp.]
MTPAGLPEGIAALRGALLRGDIGLQDALARQHAAFVADPLHSATAVFDPPASLPGLALPLAGVGLAHKDIFMLRGRAPGRGTDPALNAGPPSAAAATLIRRLDAAGSQPLAALAMAEHACGATGENPHYPLPRNPVDAQAAVGGSSSGSAVAVAAGLCYGSLGTDTAGSVRIPAATCGILGLKPTRGLLPTQGIAPLAPSLDTAGILARDAADAALILENLVAPAQARRLFPQGAQAWADAPDATAWRVATCWEHPNPAVTLSSEVGHALQGLVDALPAGTARKPVALDGLPTWTRLADTLLHAEAASIHSAALREDAPALTPLTRTVALAGAALPAVWYLDALRQRGAHARRFVAQALRGVDLLLTPALPRGVPDWRQVLTGTDTFEPRQLLDMFSWMAFVNYLGLPAIVFPIGLDSRKRPISIQAIARPGHEARLLAFARHVERARPRAASFLPSPL